MSGTVMMLERLPTDPVLEVAGALDALRAEVAGLREAVAGNPSTAVVTLDGVPHGLPQHPREARRMRPEDWLSIQEVADWLGLEYQSIRRGIKDKSIPALKMGGSFRLQAGVVLQAVRFDPAAKRPARRRKRRGG